MYSDPAVGVASQVIAAWMGRTNAAFSFENYAHARPEDLAAARDALASREGRSKSRCAIGVQYGALKHQRASAS